MASNILICSESKSTGFLQASGLFILVYSFSQSCGYLSDLRKSQKRKMVTRQKHNMTFHAIPATCCFTQYHTVNNKIL